VVEETDGIWSASRSLFAPFLDLLGHVVGKQLVGLGAGAGLYLKIKLFLKPPVRTSSQVFSNDASVRRRSRQ